MNLHLLTTKLIATLAALALAVAALPAAAQLNEDPPELATGYVTKPLARAKRYMVAAANPHAVDAGLEILGQAAVRSTPPSPCSSCSTWSSRSPPASAAARSCCTTTARTGRIASYDGRETTPALARPDRLLRPDGTPLPFREAIASGLSVGVPGAIRMLELAHKRHGRSRGRASSFRPSAWPSDGFPVSPRLTRSCAASAPTGLSLAGPHTTFSMTAVRLDPSDMR